MKRKQLIIPILIIAVVIIITFTSGILQNSEDKSVTKPGSRETTESEIVLPDKDTSDAASSDISSGTGKKTSGNGTSGTETSKKGTSENDSSKNEIFESEDISDEAVDDPSQTVEEYVVQLEEDEVFEIN